MPVEVLYAETGPEGDLSPTIDIVAVHGLNPTNRDDHPVATWTDSKSGHLWLRDALPNSEPSARVLVYSYNSSPAFGNDKDRFIFQANSFLECLRLIRRKDPNLPLIMIGHSLGGILIKQALINAQNNPKYTDIKQATFGLMFFGTPHSGPTDDLEVKFGRACVKIAQSVSWKVSNDIMEALKKGSLFSDVLSEHWRHQLEQYQIVSFYEGIGNLVPRESAVLGLDGRRENQVKLDATHEDMCPFNPSVKKDTDNYFLVEGNIADLCSKCPARYTEEEYKEFIKSLRVWSYNPRLEKISDKHRQSLQWIWNDHEDGPGFVKWLRSDVPIYWITGLPGSGKSTLMKYLYENPQTKNYISTNGGTVTAIGYFFHDLGVDKETRFESLLASILEALSASSGTLASLCATYFLDLKRLKSGPRHSPWHERHLRKALELIGQSDAFGNILLFVDGLDECSGDHRKQLEFLVPWIQSTQRKRLTIRMCLSSRPLPKIRLRLSAFPECRVHEWTANDISAYVRDRLNQTWNGLALSNQKSHTHFKGTLINYLTNTVIGKAQGVFLWVELVVNNLIVGMEEGSSDIELRECLDSLPPELEDLYARIFEQIPKDYIHDATIYFMLAVMHRSIGLLDFFLATRDPEEALARKIQSSYEDHLTMKYACARAETRIESRCRGLLQVKQNEEYKTTSHYTPSETEDITPLVSVMGKNVEFLHLSVRDYIASRVFATSSPSELGVDIAFMARSIGLLNLLRPGQLFQYRFGADEEFPPLMEYMEASNCIESPFSGFRPIEEFFLYAWFPANSPRSYQRRLLSELDRVCSLAYKDWHSAYLESALEDFYGETPVIVSSDCWNTDIFCLCLAHGLYTYVREEIEVYGYKLEDRTGRPLLHFFFDLCYTQNRIPNLDVLRLLLRRGAKPNEVFDDKTSWDFALLAIDNLLCSRRKEPENWTEPLLVLLKHGAIPNQCTGGSDSALMVVCRNIDENNWLLHGIKGLIETMISRGAKMEQRELKWAGTRCGQQIRTFLEKTLEEVHISSFKDF